jgi:lipoprotein-anchoring transpeptidase ErfK/SrfK
MRYQNPLKLFILVLLSLCLAAVGLADVPAGNPEDHPIYRDLVKAGYTIHGVGTKYGVPYVEIVIPPGEAIYTLCRKVPSLNARFLEARAAIGTFNGLNPFYKLTREEEAFSINVPTLKIPLDFTVKAEIFPQYDEKLARQAKFLLVDVGKEHLALYQHGQLTNVYPISPGALGGLQRSTTPLRSFTVQRKIVDAYSAKYDDAWMPFALHVGGPYYIHGGVLPGRPDSKGCIRLFIEHARELFDLVEVGTPGRIVNSKLAPESARLQRPKDSAQ